MYFPSGLGTGLYALSVLRRVSVNSCDLTSEALIRAAKNRATKTRATLEWSVSTVSASLDASTALELLQCDNGQSPEKQRSRPGGLQRKTWPGTCPRTPLTRWVSS